VPQNEGAGFANVLDRCLAVRAAEQVVLLTDQGTDDEVVAGLIEGIERRGGVPVLTRIPTPPLPGSEPPPAVAAMMREAGAIIELTSLFIGSSAARRRATDAGARYLAMPGVTFDTFRDDGPLTVDFDAIRADAERIGDSWSRAGTYRLTTPGGTDLRGSVEGRHGRVLHGVARTDGAYMAPPDIEAGTAPVEGSTEGTVVVDADLLFMGVGPLPEPVVIHVKAGEMVGLEGGDAGRLREMLERCGDERMTNIAEVSMAFNPAGRVCGVPMETESALGTAHIALGNSIAYGGTVDAVAHLDCVMKDATLEVDGRPAMVAGTIL
jgi:leucyl aminopeptidase (aminopeptidase T)